MKKNAKVLAVLGVVLATGCLMAAPADSKKESFSSLYSKASKLHKAKEIPEAVAAYEAAIQFALDNPGKVDDKRLGGTYFLCGICKTRNQDYKGALVCFEEAQRLYPRPAHLIQTALTYGRLGDEEKMVEYYQAAIELSGGKEPTAWIELAKVDLKNNDPAAAKKKLDKAEELLVEEEVLVEKGELPAYQPKYIQKNRNEIKNITAQIDGAAK